MGTIRTSFSDAEQERIFAAVDAAKLKRVNPWGETGVGLDLTDLFDDCEATAEGGPSMAGPEDFLSLIDPLTLSAGRKPRLEMRAELNSAGNFDVFVCSPDRADDAASAETWYRRVGERIVWIHDVGQIEDLQKGRRGAHAEAAAVASEFLALAFSKVVERYEAVFDVQLTWRLGVEYDASERAVGLKWMDAAGNNRPFFDDRPSFRKRWNFQEDHWKTVPPKPAEEEPSQRLGVSRDVPAFSQIPSSPEAPRAPELVQPSAAGGLGALKRASEAAARRRSEEAAAAAAKNEAEKAEATRRAQKLDYHDLRATAWPAELAEEFGVSSTLAFIELLNEHREATGRHPVLHGAFPTSARILQNFVREARSSGLQRKVEGPKPG